MLNSNQFPAHTHNLYATTTVGTTNVPSATVGLASPPNIVITTNNKPVNIYAVPTANTMTTLAPGTVGVNPGGGQAHDNMMPYLTLSYMICVQGLYPVRQ
jgi:Microcystin-dependent protein